MAAICGNGDSPEGQQATKHRKIDEHTHSMPARKPTHVLRLERAAAALRPGAPPAGNLLPCRTAERRKIASHLQSGVETGGSTQVLYVSGLPGTGKTAVVLEVLEKLKLESTFRLVHINAMRLGAPVQIFREIADQLLGEPTTNLEAQEQLTAHFRSRQMADPVVVLLIDEVDMLVTPTQAILYKVFDWLGMPNARLVLAAISNTMDLPERLLPRVASRFHIERVDFGAYTKAQLYEILQSRLRGHRALESFGDMTLRLCAARVAGASGDIRKALQVCRRAVETRLENEERQGPVTIADLEVAEKELISANPVSQAVLGLSAQARRFLAAVVIELRRKETDSVLLRKAASRFQKVLALVANEFSRGDQAACESASVAESEDTAQVLAQRLEAMSILAKQTKLASSAGELSSGPVICLHSLDVEDLASTLLKVEEDPTLCQLLEDGIPAAEQARIFKQID